MPKLSRVVGLHSTPQRSSVAMVKAALYDVLPC
jgi:hypothetical protein